MNSSVEQSSGQAAIAPVQGPAGSKVGEFLCAHGRKIAILLCVYAGLRILFFCVAFPFFNSIDEQFQVAVVRMYARGQWPGKDLPHFDSDTAKIASLYATPEYLNPAGFSPLYQASPQDAAKYGEGWFRKYLRSPSFEAQSPPVYYLLSAVWCRFGESVGVHGWELMYWLRLLSPVAYALFVWTSHLFLRKAYPGRVFLWLGVTALLAVFPQDVYFGTNRDVLLAPTAAIALLLMLKAVDHKESGKSPLIAASLLVGLAFLVDVSNFVLYGALGVALVFWVQRSPMATQEKTWTSIGAVTAALALPFVWILRNYIVIGDLTASRAKVQILGWSTRPLAEIFHHPLFSSSGLSYFLTELTKNFWRGEFRWHGQQMSWPVADWFYVISSAVMIVVFAVQFLRNWKTAGTLPRLAEMQASLLVAGSVVFMAAISLPFDYHGCVNPSREHPFFVAGRVITGALLPFVLIYVKGLETILAPIRKWAPAAALIGLIVFITITEFSVRRVALSSPWNFYAIRAWQQAPPITEYRGQ
jgi:Dolichyl-phosphate-mannose-protein mannosyltransferase